MDKIIKGVEEATEAVDTTVVGYEVIGTREVVEGISTHPMSAIKLQRLHLPINHKHATRHKHILLLDTRK